MAAGIIANVVSGLGSITGQAYTNRMEMANYREQRAFDERMWHESNLYNSPAMQMQRMREAGLNPNLMYQQGNVGNTTPMTSPNPPSLRNPFQNLGSNVMGAIQLYQNLRQSEAQIAVQHKQAAVLEQEAMNKAVTRALDTYRVQQSEAEAPYYGRIAHYDATAKETEVSRGLRELAMRDIDYVISQQTMDEMVERARYITRDVKQRALRGELDLDLQRELKPYGMSTSDPLWQRKLLPVIERYLMKWMTGGRSKTLYDLVR